MTDDEDKTRDGGVTPRKPWHAPTFEQIEEPPAGGFTAFAMDSPGFFKVAS